MINLEIGINIYTVLCIKIVLITKITNKYLLHSTVSSTQNSAITYMEKKSEKELKKVNLKIKI